jgi:hypothetical protein
VVDDEEGRPAIQQAALSTPRRFSRLFAGLRIWRHTLVAPFAAHLALNIPECVWIGLVR